MGIPTGRSQDFARQDKDMHIICRPSQFARFVILRHIKYGEQNNMACLNMRLVVPPREVESFDVSHNPSDAENKASDFSEAP